jgi:peptide/nickel transport system permease protein
MRYFLIRFGRFLIVFFIVTFGVMVLLRVGLNAPGDPARTMLGGTASQQQIDTVTARYHLDQNLLVQYFWWLKGMLTGDMGVSVQQNLTVAEYIKPRVLTTLLLGVYSMVFALVIAVPLAVFQAYRRDSWRDKTANFFSFVFLSLPALVLGPIFILLFVSHLGWFPRIGEKIYPWDDPWEHFLNFFLPTLILTLPLAAIWSRVLRADMALTLQADFVTLASAKGMPPKRVLWRHGLPNSLYTLLTSVGFQVGGLIGGAIVVEQLFAMKGMGSLLVTSVLSKDLFVVQAIVAIIVVVVVVVNLVIDMLYAVIDPRIRQMRAMG